MHLFLRPSLFLFFSGTLTLLLLQVDEADSIYAYAIKGIVKDVRLRPTKFIGGWFFKKAFILKKLKLKWKLKKKLILKKLLKKLLLVGRRKRAVLFPEDNHQQFQHQQQSQQSQVYSDSDFLTHSDLELLQRLPENLRHEYNNEMEVLHAAGSEPEEQEIQDYLSVAKEFDNGSCIPRSICEIMARSNNRTNNAFEGQVMEYYRTSPTQETSSNNPTHIYDYAANLGMTSRDPRTCSQHFSTCPDPPQTLNEFMNEVFTPEMCEYNDKY